jgi:hypothetical protein
VVLMDGSAEEIVCSAVEADSSAHVGYLGRNVFWYVDLLWLRQEANEKRTQCSMYGSLQC